MSTGSTSKDALKAGVLSPERASAMVAQAVREQAPIQLSLSENFLEPCVWGVLAKEADGEILLDVVRVASTMDGHREVTCLYGTIELLDCRYFFDVNLLKPQGEWESGALLEFHWPMTIAVEERRRSRRRRFQETTKVTLVVLDNGCEKQLDAVLFNVSLHGLACKITEDEASGLDVGFQLRVRMRIGSSPELFEEEAAIVNRTPGVSPGQVVLGMDFLAEPSRRFCDAVRTGGSDARD